RPRVDRRRRSQLLQPSRLHHPDAVGDGERLLLVVCHEERGDSDLQLHSTDLVAQSSSDFRIERRQWLVQKQNLWLDGERSGQGDTLLLTTRKLVGEPICVAAEPDELESFAPP